MLRRRHKRPPIERFSPELRFVIACCRWPYDAAAVAALRQAAADIADWSRVIDVAKRHRVRGLLAAAVDAAELPLPERDAARLANAAHILRIEGLHLAGATIRLDRLFARHDIDRLFVKGAALAAIAYRHQGIKESIDVDVLVDAAAIGRIFAVLIEAGYRCAYPEGLSLEELAAWTAHAHEATWTEPATGRAIDLHWRLISSTSLLPSLGIASPRTDVALADGVGVATLARGPLAAYLCVHGAEHSWVRLKWLADLAALLGTMSAAEIEGLIEDALAGGARHCVVPALILVRDLLGMAVPASVDALTTRRDRILVALAHRAIRHREDGDPAASTFSHIPHGLAPMIYETAPRELGRRIAALATNPIDRARGRLPDGAAWLYPVLRVGQWALRKTGMLTARTPR
ncbi:nucleotidyltransferase family protein [Sphingomonas donggukensis]|uniref:Nucleotidyltransferase family protein n=1 Tax=Sphingomonas donggukensis TaxID=2949093 RepID=A0ABY4TQH5_9SPHN|nr:nucleotidyltransferase family protein [Sphingomonas donggukensis]URW74467.1 nucleotidyltransferase family protein [Sphingomonas donggukensis]